MDFLEQKEEEILTNLHEFFRLRIEADPEAVLRQVEAELESLYVRYGNDWTGRGMVGDTTLMATIAALEGIRAECRVRLERTDASS